LSGFLIQIVAPHNGSGDGEREMGLAGTGAANRNDIATCGQE